MYAKLALIFSILFKADLLHDNVSDLSLPPESWLEKTKDLDIKCDDCDLERIKYSDFIKHYCNCPTKKEQLESDLKSLAAEPNEDFGSDTLPETLVANLHESIVLNHLENLSEKIKLHLNPL